MRLHLRIWLGVGAVIAATMAVDLAVAWRQAEAEIRERVDNDARIIRAMLMATRRVYHEQFIASGLAVEANTVGFLPAHALSRISADFHHWIESGLSFNNVSDRPRNPGNRADADEQAAIDWFRAHPDAGERIAEIRSRDGSAYYHFTAPIWTEAYCLECHGDPAAAPESIRRSYAEGYGYKLGDLRGVMSIKLPIDELRARAGAELRRAFGLRAGGYLVLLLLLGSLLQRLVLRRLARLDAAARRLGGGDLGARAEVGGSDEIATLAGSFNDMATAIAGHEAQIDRLNRFYSALSETNQTIVRHDDEAELLASVCRIAVDYGGVRMAWIGAADVTAGRMRVVTCHGEGIAYLDGFALPLDPAQPESRGPSVSAWRSGKPVIVQDFFADATTQHWQESARRYGWASSAAFPICRGGTPTMVLSLYQGETNGFDAKIVDLLDEMAMDIGYALDRIDLLSTREAMHTALTESENRYRSVVATSLDGFCLTDRDGRLLEVNDAYVAFSGYRREQLLTMSIADLDAGNGGEAIASHLERAVSAGGTLFETRHRVASGELRPVEVSAGYTAEQRLFSLFVRDLSKRHEAEARIQRLAHFDTLTGLPNRTLFADRVNHALARVDRSRGALALMFIDLDHFKRVNDSLGHRAGDQLLVGVSERLQQAVRAEDTVCRLGGDEFMLLLPQADAGSAAHVAEKLLTLIARPFLIDGEELDVTPSIGIALYPSDGDDFETLLRRADTATNRAKLEGRNAYRFFTPEMQAQSARTLKLEAALRRALERRELHLHYQPQVAIAGGAVIGVEALLRWQHPELGSVSPAEFIPIAERSGLILPIGEWVLRTALCQLRAWRDAGLMLPQVAVNLSAVQFRQPNLAAIVDAALAAAGLPTACLELELTESVTMENPVAAIAVMDELHARGVGSAIDDFGTGYSSLSYLKRFRVDKLKIDQSFVRGLGRDPEDEAIVRAIINLAATMKFATVAEGVETAAQLDFLRANGCTEVQGYYFSRPLPADDLAAWLRARAATSD